jgi:phosphoribosylamine--glycine ligase
LIISVIGPSKIGAQLEGSKEFAKEFLVKHPNRCLR